MQHHYFSSLLKIELLEKMRPFLVQQTQLFGIVKLTLLEDCKKSLPLKFYKLKAMFVLSCEADCWDFNKAQT
jgi:hypothetical protein